MPDTEPVLTNIEREELCSALISAFPTRGEMARLINFKLDADLEVIAKGETYADVVFNLVRWAVAQAKVAELVTGARKQNPGNRSLRAVAERTLGKSPEKAPLDRTGRVPPPVRTDVGGPVVPPPGTGGGDAQFTFVDIGSVSQWAVRLQRAAAAVCRLELHNSMATAFLIGPDLALTCYHVLQELIEGSQYENPVTGQKTILTPDGVALRFGYWRAADGVEVQPGHLYRLAADWLVDCSPSEELDYALLRTSGTPGEDVIEVDGGEVARRWLRPSENVEYQRQAPLYVLQHANGGPLQVTYGTGAVMEGQNARFTFSTLTAPGASGAPCFSGAWEWVGMYESKQAGFRRQAIPAAAIIAQPRVRAALARGS